MTGSDARRSDRYLISNSKYPAVLETDDGQTVPGYLSDVSTTGCMFVTPPGILKLRKHHGVAIVAGSCRMEGKAVRSSVSGTRASIGIHTGDMPADFFDRVRKVGGALRFDRRTISVINMLTMPVAVQAMRLLRQPETAVVNLRECTGLELAGAGFLVVAAERRKKIENVGDSIATLVKMAGIKLAP